MLHSKGCALEHGVLGEAEVWKDVGNYSNRSLCLLSSLCIFAVLSFPSARYKHTLHTSKKEVLQPMSS